MLDGVVLALLLVLTVLAFEIRYSGLDRRDGDLSTDEARLGLAAEGVLATGLPVLPSGRVYTRGLITTYLMAPSLDAFGLHDWALRLPSVVAGALLVPAVFLLGRTLFGAGVAGSVGALAAAAFVVVAEPLVTWSRQAWPPAMFLLLFVLAAYTSYRGFGRDERRWQPVAAGCFLVTLLAYELALLLPLGLGLYLLGRAARRDSGWWQGRWTVAALAIGACGLGLLLLLGLALRAGSLAGSDAEFRHYFTPGLVPSGVRFYVQSIWGRSLPLLLLVPVGWLASGLLGRGRRPGGLGFLLALLVPALAVPIFVIQGKQEQQYGLAVLPLIGLVGAWGIAAMGQREETGGTAPSPNPSPLRGRGEDTLTPAVSQRARVLVMGVALVGFGAVLWGDIGAARRAQVPSRGPAWIEDLRSQGWQPSDLVFAEAPLVHQLYFGGADFYVQPDGFERYARQDGDVIRSLYTNAVLLKEAGDFERLVDGPYAGRTLWIVGHDDRLPRLARQMDPALWQRLMAASGVSRPTRGWWIMRVELPVGSRQAGKQTS